MSLLIFVLQFSPLVPMQMPSGPPALRVAFKRSSLCVLCALFGSVRIRDIRVSPAATRAQKTSLAVRVRPRPSAVNLKRRL